MTRQTWAIVLAWAVPFVAGCGSYDIETADPGKSSGLPTEQANEPTDKPTEDTTSSSDTPSGEQPGESQPAARSSTERPRSAESKRPRPKPRQPAKPEPAPSRRPSIRLSTGVALPQTLPSGTAVGFSVDYRFVQGAPDPAAMYGWVIEPTKGQAVKQEVRLQAQGTLQGFVLQFRPENGPFSSHIVDAHGNRLSDPIALR